MESSDSKEVKQDSIIPARELPEKQAPETIPQKEKLSYFQSAKKRYRETVARLSESLDRLKNSITNNTVSSNWKVLQEKYEKIKVNIDKLDKEIKKFKEAREYFFKGALIGGSLGFLYGIYVAHRTKKMMKIPKATLGTGISIGSLFACYPMAQTRPINRFQHLDLYTNPNGWEQTTNFWRTKYETYFI